MGRPAKTPQREAQMQTIIAIQQADLDRIVRDLADIKAQLAAVQMAPRPEWLTVKQYASSIGRSERTVKRRIAEGQIETREECGVTLIKAGR